MRKLTWNVAISTAALLTLTSLANAADFSVCEDIAGKAGALVDRSDSEQWQQSVDDEFAKVCKYTKHYETNLAASSNATRAAFGYAGFQLGYGQSASDANA